MSDPKPPPPKAQPGALHDLVAAIQCCQAILGGGVKLTKFESEYIILQARYLMSNKVLYLSETQTRMIASIYARTLLRKHVPSTTDEEVEIRKLKASIAAAEKSDG